MKRSLSVEWYRGCNSDDARKTRKGLVSSSPPVREVLEDIANSRRDDLLRLREADYNAGSWAYLQAHRNGRLEELDRLLELLRSATTNE